MKRKYWETAQYSRKECSAVVGIYRQVDDNQLETKVLSIFEKVGCTIDLGFIDECHCLGKNNDRVIVKFTRRKDFKQVLQARKDLKDLNTDDLDFLPRGTKILKGTKSKAYAHIIVFYGLKVSDYIVWVSLIAFTFL